MPTLRDVAQDAVLTNVAVKYTNEAYIADQILPTFTVKKQNGKYYVYDSAQMRPVKTLRAIGAGANEVDYGVSCSGTYGCDDHALKEFVAEEIQDQADQPIDPLIDATENVTERILIGKEKDLATNMASTSVLTNYSTLSGTDRWDDYTNSDPIDDVKTAKAAVHAKIFKTPNTLVLQKQVYEKLLDHPDIVERIKYSQLGVANAALLARIFDVENVLIASAGYNSADEGQADAHSYIWGKHAWLVYIAPTVKAKQVTFGYTFTYQTRVTEKWTDGDLKGTFVRVHENYDQKFVSVDAAYALRTVIS
jgi:hypothetical protein